MRPATLLKKSFWHRCIPLNIAKFLRSPFQRTLSVAASDYKQQDCISAISRSVLHIYKFCSEMFIISTQPLLIATPSFLLLKHHLRDYDIKFVKLPCNFILYSFSLSLIFVLHYLKEIFTLARREILSILLYMYTYIIEQIHNSCN